MGAKLNQSDNLPWGTIPTTGPSGSTPTATTDSATQAVQASNESQRQALAAKSVPPPPLNDFIQGGVKLSPAGCFWLTQMWRRSGANVAPSTSDLALLSVYGDETASQSRELFDGIEDATLLGITSEPHCIRTMDLPLSSQIAEYLALLGDATPRQFALTGDVTKPYNSTTTTLTNIPTATTMAGYLLATAIAAPSTPAAGKASLYVDSTSKNLAVKNDAGTVNHGVQTKASVSHNFLTAIADNGTVSAAQPDFTDLSGSATATQITTALASPPAIGGTVAAAVTGTTVTATSSFSGPGTNLSGTGASFTAGTATVANGLKSATTTVSVSSATAPSKGQALVATASNTADWEAIAKGAATSTPSDPTGTTSATAVMMGLAVAFTPGRSRTLLIMAAGQMYNSTAGDGATVKLMTGTGTAPANGDASTGVQRGASQSSTSVSANQRSGFCIPVFVTGLTSGTAYWIDLGLTAVTGGTANVKNLTISVCEF